MLVPPPVDSLRSALCMNVWPVLGLGTGDGEGISDFLTSFEPGATAAPKGLVKSGGGVEGGDLFPGGVVAVPVPIAAGGVFALEENFELILDIHEFLLPGGATFGSLGLLGVPGLCEATFSELERGRRGRWR